MPKSLQDFLEERAEVEFPGDRQERVEEWVSSVNSLLETLRSWLESADPKRRLVVEAFTLSKTEQGLGEFVVNGLLIRLGSAVIRVIPVSRRVLGAIRPGGGEPVLIEGRVDVTDGARKFMLYRTLTADGERWYAMDDERYEITNLDQSRFEAIVQELLS